MPTTDKEWKILQDLHDHPGKYDVKTAKSFLRQHKPSKYEDDIVLHIYNESVEMWWDGNPPKYLLV